jgi:alkanesulfonate monooxygenase SsuD/methylene tetrahydromethanopterin reductase-like flavin-dependent oxidoreductase (luciferase family)
MLKARPVTNLSVVFSHSALGPWIGFSAALFIDDKVYKVKNIRLMRRPVQSPHPPLLIGAGAPKAIQRAGRMGCHFVGLADPGGQRIYDSALQQAGQDIAENSEATAF